MPLCNLPFDAKVWSRVHSALFPGPPPRVLLERGLAGKRAECHGNPSPANTRRKPSSQNQLLPHVNTGLAQQLGYRIALQA